MSGGASLPLRAFSSAQRTVARGFDFLARRPIVAGLIVALLAFALAWSSTAAHGYPLPHISDEFSYLLGAETFARGRLANPPHPMGVFFETLHVIQLPTYASKYPPTNALFLATGLLMTGRPIVGVWLSFAFMCVATYWMLRAWIGAKWGFAVSLAFPSWAALSYWSYTYWGGAVAAGAGALVLGALYRIVRGDAEVRNGVTLGLGLVLLGSSRPYEGALLAVPVAIVFLQWFARARRRVPPPDTMRVVLPLALVLVAGIAASSVYNRAVTGKWYEMPYISYQLTHDSIPFFLWERPYALRSMRSASEDKAVLDAQPFRGTEAWADSLYRAARTFSGRQHFVRTLSHDVLLLVVPLGLALPLLLIPIVARSWWMRFALLCIAWETLGLGLSTYFYLHYAAPMFGLVVAVYGECLRWLARLRLRTIHVGHAFAVAILLIWGLRGAAATAQLVRNPLSEPTASPLEWTRQRKLIADTLVRRHPRSLVVVRYSGQHEFWHEWVFNDADVDASPLVWARDLGDANNKRLLEYYRDREVWLVEVTGLMGPFRVSPYRPGAP
jgi:hypothetical protein